MSAKARVRTLLDAIDGGPWGTGAVVVTTYGMVSANPHHFAPRGRNQKWDYVVLDEGHQIKNPSTKWVKNAATVTRSPLQIVLCSEMV